MAAGAWTFTSAARTSLLNGTEQRQPQHRIGASRSAFGLVVLRRYCRDARRPAQRSHGRLVTHRQRHCDAWSGFPDADGPCTHGHGIEPSDVHARRCVADIDRPRTDGHGERPHHGNAWGRIPHPDGSRANRLSNAEHSSPSWVGVLHAHRARPNRNGNACRRSRRGQLVFRPRRRLREFSIHRDS